MASWDDENFEPKEITPVIIRPNKWEGEDEEDDVKDNWEDEDEEQKPEEPKPVVNPPPKPKKKDTIAEKERLRKERKEKEQAEELEEPVELTPHERLILERESDLSAAVDTFGISTTSGGLDAMNPVTKEEFDDFAEALTSKVLPFTKSLEFPTFAETVVRNICASMSSGDIKKIKNTLDNLYVEKQKIEKGDKAKKNKGKGKAKLKMDNESQFSAYVDDYDEFDDFM